MFHVEDVSFPAFLWFKDWPKPQPFLKQSRKLVRGLTMGVTFLSPDREIVTQFGDCLLFGDMCLLYNPGGMSIVGGQGRGRWPQNLPLKFLLEPQILPPKI